jgi:hypothetical protein
MLALLICAVASISCKKNSDEATSSTATITAIACGTASFSSTATINSAYAATATIAYTGGNAVAFTAGTTINSTGVTGLTATLQAGTLANGNGNLSYTIVGTPTTSGTASFAISFAGQSCTLSLTVNAIGGVTLPSVYSKIYGATSITTDGTWVTIKCKGLPDHKSVYYPTTNALYENFSGTTFGGNTFSKNPSTIAEFAYIFKIPLNPVAAATHATTPGGAMGVAINGVPLFNQYAAGGSPLTGEIVSFDQGWGHPQQQGGYHYHVEPTKLTAIKGSDALMGFLLDGFPVYGPKENGVTVTGLDVYHGHSHATVDYPAGIYHYHFSADAPYLNGNGFWGTAGTVTN